MDQKMFIIILVIFLLTNNFSKIFTDIIKGIVYLLLILALLKIINPSIGEKIKKYLLNILNSDNIFSPVASQLKTFIKTTINMNEIIDKSQTNEIINKSQTNEMTNKSQTNE